MYLSTPWVWQPPVGLTRAIYFAVICLSLVGCASRQLIFHAPDTIRAIDEPFTVAGRLSVNLNGRGQVARFDWQHTPVRDELEIKTPLGTSVARLIRDADGARLETDDGSTWYAPDVDTLTAQRLGWTLPMANLIWWIRGRPAPGVSADVQADGALRQQGWTIRFLTDADAHSHYPKRVDLVRDHLTLRLVLQTWR